ncbi:alpha/beta fold hydrolase [Actinomadura sp. J1-007]|nr:alpha/beta fold hydrolase [Actinomadura sp. J1-007]
MVVSAAALAAIGPAACGVSDSPSGATPATGSVPGPARSGRSGPAGGLPASITGQRPEWRACQGLPKPVPGTSTPPSGFQCATVKVPLDYARPGGDTIGLALLRVKATDPSKRVGSLVFNFGGPGGDGVTALAQSAGSYRTLNTRYDLIGLDPRGVGRSAPVTCVDDRRMDEINAQDDSPDDAAEERALTAARESYDRGCAARSGRLLPHVGTPSAARDLDVVRTVLGDRGLHYFGVSYGTWLGGSYAHLFPRAVGRAVLDGAVDTRISTEDLDLQQAAAFQRALRSFGTACAGLGRDACPLGRDSASVVAAIGTLLDGLDRAPLPTSGGRRLTQSLGTTGVSAALYSEQAWPTLAQGLAEAVRQHDGTTLLTLADLQNGREDDGRYSNLSAANTAITCADTPDRYTVQDVRRVLPKFRNASPVFGPSMAWSMLQCTGWPVRGDAAAQRVAAPGAAPILVVGNTGDPATPYAWAPALVKEIGKSAALLTLKGQGHGAYDTNDACVRAAVDAYLLDGRVPADGTTCG